MAETRSKLTWGERALFWTMVAASFGLVFGVAVLPACRKSIALEQRLTEMRQSNQQIAESIETLKLEGEALQKDSFYVEKLARKMGNLRRPGETVVVSLVQPVDDKDTRVAALNSPSGSVMTEVMERLEPLATNGLVRFVAVVLALGNMLAAFVLFGRDDGAEPVQPTGA